MDLEKCQPVLPPSTPALPDYVIEFLSIFVYVVCVESVNIAHLYSGGTSWDLRFITIYLCGIIMLITYATRNSCPRLVNAHQSPGITLTLAIFQEFPLKKVPSYLFAQFLGSIFGTLFVYDVHNKVVEVLPASLLTMANSMVTIPNLSPANVGAAILGNPNRHIILEIVFGIVIGTSLLNLARYRSNQDFVDGPGYVLLMASLYITSACCFRNRLLLNTAHGLGAQVASWILYNQSLLLEPKFLITNFINVFAIMAAALCFTPTPRQPLTKESTECC